MSLAQQLSRAHPLQPPHLHALLRPHWRCCWWLLFRYRKLRVGKLLLVGGVRYAAIERRVAMSPVCTVFSVLVVRFKLRVLVILVAVLEFLLVDLVILLVVLEVVIVLEIVVTGSIRAVHPAALAVKGIVFTVWINLLSLLALLVIWWSTVSWLVIIRVVNVILRVAMRIILTPVVVSIRPIALVILTRIYLIFVVQVVALVMVVLIL